MFKIKKELISVSFKMSNKNPFFDTYEKSRAFLKTKKGASILAHYFKETECLSNYWHRSGTKPFYTIKNIENIDNHLLISLIRKEFEFHKTIIEKSNSISIGRINIDPGVKFTSTRALGEFVQVCLPAPYYLGTNGSFNYPLIFDSKDVLSSEEFLDPIVKSLIEQHKHVLGSFDNITVEQFIFIKYITSLPKSAIKKYCSVNYKNWEGFCEAFDAFSKKDRDSENGLGLSLNAKMLNVPIYAYQGSSENTFVFLNYYLEEIPTENLRDIFHPFVEQSR